MCCNNTVLCNLNVYLCTSVWLLPTVNCVLNQDTVVRYFDWCVDCSFPQGSPNSSISCSVPNLACTPIATIHRLTPVASLRTPQAKRPALGTIAAFSAVDISHFGTWPSSCPKIDIFYPNIIAYQTTWFVVWSYLSSIDFLSHSVCAYTCILPLLCVCISIYVKLTLYKERDRIHHACFYIYIVSITDVS